MTAARSVLLMESERAVIKDLTCSLRLIDLPVQEVGSVLEAKSCVRSNKPALVLARPVVGSDSQAGITLARELSADRELQSIPVVLLCTPSEKSLIENDLNLFDAEVILPVEFPAVTYQIQDLLKRFAAGKNAAAEPLNKTAPVDTVEQVTRAGLVLNGTIAEVAIPRLTPEQERNLHVAYRIQLAVLDELRRSRFFGKIDPEKVPNVVAAVTKSVCHYFDQEKSDPGKK